MSLHEINVGFFDLHGTQEKKLTNIYKNYLSVNLMSYIRLSAAFNNSSADVASSGQAALPILAVPTG